MTRRLLLLLLLAAPVVYAACPPAIPCTSTTSSCDSPEGDACYCGNFNGAGYSWVASIPSCSDAIAGQTFAFPTGCGLEGSGQCYRIFPQWQYRNTPGGERRYCYDDSTSSCAWEATTSCSTGDEVTATAYDTTGSDCVECTRDAHCDWPDPFCSSATTLQEPLALSCTNNACGSSWSSTFCDYGCETDPTGPDYCDPDPDGSTECCFFEEGSPAQCDDKLCGMTEVCQRNKLLPNFGYCLDGPPPPNYIYRQEVDSGSQMIACQTSGWQTTPGDLETNECTYQVTLRIVGLDDESDGVQVTNPGSYLWWPGYWWCTCDCNTAGGGGTCAKVHNVNSDLPAAYIGTRASPTHVVQYWRNNCQGGLGQMLAVYDLYYRTQNGYVWDGAGFASGGYTNPDAYCNPAAPPSCESWAQTQYGMTCTANGASLSIAACDNPCAVEGTDKWCRRFDTDLDGSLADETFQWYTSAAATPYCDNSADECRELDCGSRSWGCRQDEFNWGGCGVTNYCWRLDPLNTNDDDYNCGTCGNACPWPSYCDAGTCCGINGNACANNDNCCNPDYYCDTYWGGAGRCCRNGQYWNSTLNRCEPYDPCSPTTPRDNYFSSAECTPSSLVCCPNVRIIARTGFTESACVTRAASVSAY